MSKTSTLSKPSSPKMVPKFASCWRIATRVFASKVWPKPVLRREIQGAHYHRQTEEIYYILRGTGMITIDGETRTIGPFDAIAIAPGQIHTILNTGSEPLVFLCTCAPAYEHDDTVLVAEE